MHESLETAEDEIDPDAAASPAVVKTPIVQTIRASTATRDLTILRTRRDARPPSRLGT